MQRLACGSTQIPGEKTTPSLDWRGEMHTVCVICAFESWYHHCKIENNLKYMFPPHGLELCQSMVYHLYWIYVIFIWNWPWSYTLLLAFNTVDTGVYAKFAFELLFAKLSVFLYMPMLLHEIEYWWFKCVALIINCQQTIYHILVTDFVLAMTSWHVNRFWHKLTFLWDFHVTGRLTEKMLTW